MSKVTIKKQEDSIAYLADALEKAETKEDFILSLWMYWTESVTLTSREFQQVFYDPAVNKWFLGFIRNEEKEFRRLVKQYSVLEGQGKEIDLLYVKCVNKVLSRFPQALLEAAKKRTVKPQISKTAGIKIELSIINQN